MVNLGADLGQFGFTAFLRRAAAHSVAVAALQSRVSVPSAAGCRMTSGGRPARLISKHGFSEAGRYQSLIAMHRLSQYTLRQSLVAV